MVPATVQTARLKLRPVGPQDREAVVSSLNDIAVSGWLAVVPYPYTAADFRMFQTELAKPGQTFAVEDAAGFAGIMGLEKGKLGYWLAKRAHGRGYATEAARGVLGWHFAQELGPVASGHFDGNAASAKVLCKLGFGETGRGHVMCRARDTLRPHVDLTLMADTYIAALPWEATSPRLTYRPMQATDAAALHAIVSHFDVTRQLGPKWPWPAELAYTSTRAQPFHGPGFVWGIFCGGTLIGTVGVAAGELGYMLSPAVWGQGLASEACQAAITHAFASGFNHIDAGVWADNLASHRVLTKLGFTVTGHSTDTSPARPDPSPGLTLTLSRR